MNNKLFMFVNWESAGHALNIKASVSLVFMHSYSINMIKLRLHICVEKIKMCSSLIGSVRDFHKGGCCNCRTRPLPLGFDILLGKTKINGNAINLFNAFLLLQNTLFTITEMFRVSFIKCSKPLGTIKKSKYI